jgi:hypothetical protein
MCPVSDVPPDREEALRLRLLSRLETAIAQAESAHTNELTVIERLRGRGEDTTEEQAFLARVEEYLAMLDRERQHLLG